MKLNAQEIKNRSLWEQKGYTLPSFDREQMICRTKEAPVWVHFGGGNIFRAYHAALAQKMLDNGESDTGLIVIEGFDYELIEKQYRSHDDLSVLATLKSDGTVHKTVIGSVAESCVLDSSDAKEFSRLKEIFDSPSLQLATFTITEKGYNLYGRDGEPAPAVREDFENGPAAPGSYIGKVAALLYERCLHTGAPISLVSTDNCSGNGDKLKQAVMAYGTAWTERGKAVPEFLEYLQDPDRVGFPCSMIDKITPRPDASVEAMLAADGLEDLEPVVTSKKTYAAPFVNAEETEYLVIEDWFPNGRPALEKAGVIFTTRETVERVEQMKVCTCLNPLHTALAVFGCLLGYRRICEEMKDPELLCLIRRIGYREGLPVVTDPGVLDPREFIDTVVNVRLPNPFMPDTPQRIATDTSQKLAIRYGKTIRNYARCEADGGELKLSDLKMIPLVLAGWLRYLTGIGDNGEKFELSPDPMIESVKPLVDRIPFGSAADPEEVKQALREILSSEKIFGVDLFEVNMADRICRCFSDMMKGVGAVRCVLEKETADE